MYRKRHAESAVKKLSEMFGAVLVAGPEAGRENDDAEGADEEHLLCDA